MNDDDILGGPAVVDFEDVQVDELETISLEEIIESTRRLINPELKQAICTYRPGDISIPSYRGIDEWDLLPSFNALNRIHIYNLNPDIDLQTNVEGFSEEQVRNCSLRSIRARAYLDFDNFFGVLVAGTTNSVVAFVLRDGGLLFVLDTLNVIKTVTKDLNLIRQLVNKCWTFANTQKSKYNGTDIKGLEEDVLASAIMKVINTPGSGISKGNLREFVKQVQSSVKSLFRDQDTTSGFTAIHYSLLINSNKAYRRIISGMNKKLADVKKQAYQKGIEFGSKYYIGLYQAGWSYDPSIRRWYLEMDIIPKQAFKGEKLHEIVERYQMYKITRLEIDPVALVSAGASHMFPVYCRGVHPNVNGTNVCLGTELPNEWSRLITNEMGGERDFTNFLKKLVDLLQIVNFDSSYYQIHDVPENAILPEGVTRRQMMEELSSGTVRPLLEVGAEYRTAAQRRADYAGPRRLD